MLRKLFAATLPLALSVVLAQPAAAGTIYNAVDDFSNPQASPWSYGYTTTLGSFTQFTTFSSGTYLGQAGLDAWYLPGAPNVDTPAILKNTTGGDLTYATVTQPNDLLNVHPSVIGGVEYYAVVRFTAPTSATYYVDGIWVVIDTSDLGNGTDLLLYLNGAYLDDLDSFFPYGASVPWGGVGFLNAGDTLDFIVGPNGNCATCFYYDSVGFDVTIVPEPATLLLLGFGLGAVGVRLRRRK